VIDGSLLIAVDTPWVLEWSPGPDVNPKVLEEIVIGAGKYAGCFIG
jgi:hypothetical protein